MITKNKPIALKCEIVRKEDSVGFEAFVVLAVFAIAWLVSNAAFELGRQAGLMDAMDTSSTVRSEGANNATNRAIYMTASGAQTSGTLRLGSAGPQTNIALRSAPGDNYLNSTPGNTSLGISAGSPLTVRLPVTSPMMRRR